MADTLDVLGFEEASAALAIGGSDTHKTADLARVITAASRRLDEAIGPVVQRTITSEIHDGGSSSIELNHGPVASISTVVEYQGSTAVTITAESAGFRPSDGYYAERYKPNPALMSGVLVRRVSGNTGEWSCGAGNVLVTYTAGRSVSTGAVDDRYKEAAILIVRNLWRPYQNGIGQLDEYDVPVSTFPTFGLPNAVKDLLREELQTSVGFG